MKKLFIAILISICFNSTIYSQTNIEQEIFRTKSIIFYGYDFSDFQLADGKRIGQDLRKYVFTLIGFLQEHLPEKKLQKWLEKDTITSSLNAVMLVNKKINNDDIASPIKHTISTDSIQKMINKYPITEKRGIGYVIIYECFDSNLKRGSAYSVFFDIATKKVLIVDYVSIHDSNSFNRISDWNPVAFRTIKKLTDLYLDRLPKKK